MSKANYFNGNNSFFHGLMFHHLHDKKNHKKSQGSITANQFEKILKVIKIQNIVNPISLKNSKKKILKTNKVCITFDDCLKSQIDIALPVLEKYKIKAFFFIYSNAIFGEINFHEIFRYFRQKYYKNFSKFYKDFYKEVLKIYAESKISNFFKKDDLIVFNETKVFKARLRLQKESGGQTEIFINRILSKFEAECLTKGLNLKKKSQVLKTDTFPLKISIVKEKDGLVLIKFSQNVEHLCSTYGKVPIPPYLKRDDDEFDNVRYQSVFANDVLKESAAAPTASLHFDNDLYEKITNEFSTCKINLAVGLGTFKPLSNDAINNSSKLHEENFFISDESAKKINSQLKDNKRIIAIGTTTLRALESSWNNETNSVSPGKQTTTIFIKEGFKFNVVNALLTNFHLPQSSLLMLVCAFAGKELIFSTYEFAIKNNLRFFSYGDAMIIERCPLNY